MTLTGYGLGVVISAKPHTVYMYTALLCTEPSRTLVQKTYVFLYINKNGISSDYTRECGKYVNKFN